MNAAEFKESADYLRAGIDMAAIMTSSKRKCQVRSTNPKGDVVVWYVGGIMDRFVAAATMGEPGMEPLLLQDPPSSMSTLIAISVTACLVVVFFLLTAKTGTFDHELSEQSSEAAERCNEAL